MALPLNWPQSKPFQPPTTVKEADPSEWPVPVLHAVNSSTSTSPLLHGINSDIEFDDFIAQNKGKSVSLIQFGSLHCTKCHEFFPDFLQLAKRFDRIKYGVAQVEWLLERAAGVKYSPTFTFFSKGGRKVDEVLGKDKQKLEDHLWLWQDD